MGDKQVSSYLFGECYARDERVVKKEKTVRASLDPRCQLQ